MSGNTVPAVPDWMVTEYEAIRAEILLRLGFQQQIINFSVAVLAGLAPIVAVKSSVDIMLLLTMLLLGPIASGFLALVYIKQHIFIDRLARYISEELGFITHDEAGVKDFHDGPVWGRPFKGWEKWLSKMYREGEWKRLLSVVGLAEGFFPILVGGVYLAVFAVLLRPEWTGLLIGTRWVIGLVLFAEAAFLGAIVVFAFLVRRAIKVRREAETT